jgi:membrane-bound lytic murein transglycosylase B
MAATPRRHCRTGSDRLRQLRQPSDPLGHRRHGGANRAAQQSPLLADAKRQQSILNAMSRPAEAKPWRDYRPIFLTRERINGGVQFWDSNAQILADAQQHFGVDSRVIVAIVGVETRYGGNTGSYRVLDALCTLAFDYPKRGLSRRIGTVLLLTRREQSMLHRGSYAGAMGQAIHPSSYRAYAVVRRRQA